MGVFSIITIILLIAKILKLLDISWVLVFLPLGIDTGFTLLTFFNITRKIR